MYSGYILHDNYRFEPKPWGWAGKLSGWHMQDAKIFIQCSKTYDAIRRSSALSEKQRHHIEENLFRLGGKTLTAIHPIQGISNDVAFRFGGVAIIGRLLEDEEILSWVLNEESGYAAIVDKLFFSDGAWHERSPSYHNMLCDSLYLAPYYLDGFNGISLRKIEKLDRIYYLPFRIRFPNGMLPPVNDSRWGHRDPLAEPIRGRTRQKWQDRPHRVGIRGHGRTEARHIDIESFNHGGNGGSCTERLNHKIHKINTP